MGRRGSGTRSSGGQSDGKLEHWEFTYDEHALIVGDSTIHGEGDQASTQSSSSSCKHYMHSSLTSLTVQLSSQTAFLPRYPESLALRDLVMLLNWMIAAILTFPGRT